MTGWTLTLAARAVRRAGADAVLPLALALRPELTSSAISPRRAEAAPIVRTSGRTSTLSEEPS